MKSNERNWNESDEFNRSILAKINGKSKKHVDWEINYVTYIYLFNKTKLRKIRYKFDGITTWQLQLQGRKPKISKLKEWENLLSRVSFGRNCLNCNEHPLKSLRIEEKFQKLIVECKKKKTKGNNSINRFETLNVDVPDVAVPEIGSTFSSV